MSSDRGASRLRAEGGFTLVEVMVALGLLTVVMTASLPVLLGVLRTGVAVRLETQAKNLAQERLEQIRDLRYHVDRQNGPFLDLLDLYYTHATPGWASTALTAGGTPLTGRYVAAGGELAGPHFRTTTGPLPGAPAFSQRVLAQFLAADGTPLPASRFQHAYDSQVVGRDRPPALLVGVTVITEWTADGEPRSLSAYTRLTDGRPPQPVLQSRARAIAVEISSTGADGATLQLQGGVVGVDGAQSSGSSLSAYASGARARRSGVADVTGSTGHFDLPVHPPTSSGSPVPRSGTGCSWYGFGRTQVDRVTGDVSLGLPRAPADVDSGGTRPNVLSAAVPDAGGGACGLLSFRNTEGGGRARTDGPFRTLLGEQPWVVVPDGPAPGGVQAAGHVTSTPLGAPVQQTSSGAQAELPDPVVLFPDHPASGGRGLVQAQLTAAQVGCRSGSPGTATGSYTLTLGWWGAPTPTAHASWQTATWSYDSTRDTAPRLTAGGGWDPARTFVDGRPLADLVQGDLAPAVLSEGATNGLRGFGQGILSLTTAPTLVDEGSSGISVTLGRLTCVADDRR